jgi:hypothetical protein
MDTKKDKKKTHYLIKEKTKKSGLPSKKDTNAPEKRCLFSGKDIKWT